MKLYDIKDRELKMSVGCLIYYEKTKDVVVELIDSLDEWTAPLLFSCCVKKGIYTIPRKLSAMWVKERVIPSDRQNIGSILANHGLKEYDEMKLLELSSGKCCQDALRIKQIDEMPSYVAERQKQNVYEITLCRDDSIICFFKDDLVKRIRLEELGDKLPENFMGNEKLKKSASVISGGYGISFDNAWDISAAELRLLGTELPISINDFIDFIKNSLVDTAGACNLLGCTRQNINYKVKREQLIPVMLGEKNELFIKSSIISEEYEN